MLPFARILPSEGTFYCDGPDNRGWKRVTSCDGGRDLLRGRRAVYWRALPYGLALCGRCARIVARTA